MANKSINVDEKVFASKLEDYRRRMNAQVAAIKSALSEWLEPRDNVADSVCITRALLELALDRHVAAHEANGFDMIEAAYRRALKASRGPLQ
jgi:hypothetical protein